MIQVKVKRDGNNNPILVEIRGHALFAPRGSDIVCAAVSVLAQTIVFAMEELLDLYPPVKVKKGYFCLCRPAQLDANKKDNFFLLFETMLVGLKEIAKSYPRYLSIQQSEKA
jgi:uncharacterized protein YsxB (DUF464 family)